MEKDESIKKDEEKEIEDYEKEMEKERRKDD